MLSIKEYFLRFPPLYLGLMRLFGRHHHRPKYVREYIRPFSGASILDIGCGPADILEYLPSDIEFFGIDYEQSYIDAANEKYGHRAQFICKSVDDVVADMVAQFDIVLATGVLHHLDDEQCRHLMKVAAKALKPTGRFVTWDGCFRKGQSPIARFLLSNDRGKFVRESAAYVNLAKEAFPHVSASVREDLLRVPYTLNIMTCSLAPVEHAVRTGTSEAVAVTR